MILHKVPSLHLFRRFSSVMPNLQREVASQPHVPVMANETIEYLKPSQKQLFIDMTFGAGGHTKRILDSSPEVKVIALDRDPTAHELAHEMAKEYPQRLIPILGRFSELPTLLTQLRIKQSEIDGILFDFGCSRKMARLT